MSNALDFIVIDGNLQRYQGNDVDVVIPDFVTKISKTAFKNRLDVRSITVPGHIQNLASDTFSQVYSLKKLILKPGSAKFITINGALCSADGKKLLMVPLGMESYEIPESITKIASKAFSGCRKMQSVIFPPTVTVIEEDIFGYSGPLHIVVCNPSAVIHENAFRIDILEKAFLFGTLDVPASIMKTVMTSIKRKKKSFLEKIIRTDNVTAMKRFLSLWKIIKPEELASYIQMAKAAQSTGIQEILLEKYRAQGGVGVPQTVNAAFVNEDTIKSWRKKLKLSVSDGSITVTGYTGTDVDVTIPKEIEGQKINDLKSRAFCSCRHIRNVHILASVPFIRASTFAWCESLETVKLPENLTEIKDSAFNKCRELKRIDLPETIISIGDYSFSECTSLENIIIPSSVTTIGKSAFSECTGLKSVKLPDNLELIQYKSFGLCSSLEEITIPQRVRKIEYDAFLGCSSLKKVVFSGKVCDIAHSAFQGCEKLTIHAPAGSYAETYAKENNIPFVAE